MNPRKLLDWRKALLYSHRWMGIAGGLLFVAWFISGIAFMYWTMPSFTTKERLSHLAPIDPSTARVEPMDAARRIKIKPTRLRISMYYDGRPVYRFQGTSTVYADTGDAVPGRNAFEALDFVRTLEPEHAATVRYERSLDKPDQWTGGGSLPLHKIAVGDSDDTYYYISEKTGEPVMKTDRVTRFWGFVGLVVHLLNFTSLKQYPEGLGQFLIFLSAAGSLMCLTGLVAGVWRFSIGGRFRQKGETSHSPYSGWMRWHHYAGLLFGFFSLTWIFSGGLSSNPFGFFSNTSPNAQDRQAAQGGPINLEQVTLEGLRQGIAAITPSFAPKEADVLQFRGELYLTAADGPSDPPTIGLTEGRDTAQQRASSSTPRRIFSFRHPEAGAFIRFDDSAVMDVAREALPDVGIKEATWLNEYDNYYRSRDKGQLLPVLRVRYADPQET